jgi:hypothetical protein
MFNWTLKHRNFEEETSVKIPVLHLLEMYEYIQVHVYLLHSASSKLCYFDKQIISSCLTISYYIYIFFSESG